MQEVPEAAPALVLRVPEGAKLPPDATFYEGPDDGRCRVIKVDTGRCTAVRMRAYGLCPGHAGVGGVALDPAAASKAAHVEKRKRATARAVLGISARRAAQPVQAARVAAQQRAQDFAAAVVDGPLDDPDLSTVARQQAAIRALELLYPQVTAQLEVGLPDEAEDVGAMGWQEMTALAARLLDG